MRVGNGCAERLGLVLDCKGIVTVRSASVASWVCLEQRLAHRLRARTLGGAEQGWMHTEVRRASKSRVYPMVLKDMYCVVQGSMSMMV